jgi:hypothetical protein
MDLQKARTKHANDKTEPVNNGARVIMNGVLGLIVQEIKADTEILALGAVKKREKTVRNSPNWVKTVKKFLRRHLQKKEKARWQVGPENSDCF